MSEFVKTAAAEEALVMVKSVASARQYSRIGQITGEPGTGKSALTYWLTEELNAVRVECWEEMGDKALLQEIAGAMNANGYAIDMSGTAPTLFRKIKDECKDLIIIIDEANHLKWATLEKLRALSDIGGAALILAGTDILAKRLIEARVRVYLAQLRQRIGAKKVLLSNMKDNDEVVAYIIAPRFGAVTKRTAHRFRVASYGNWRAGLELADACERLMKNEKLDKLTEAVVDTAAAWMAGQA
ncbi:AAA family ATPase [Paracoccaceae bacterium GXU_MW_L88]